MWRRPRRIPTKNGLSSRPRHSLSTRREKLPAELVFHDADSKFGAAFDDALTGQGLQPRRLQPRSPNLYAYVERWIQSILLVGGGVDEQVA